MREVLFDTNILIDASRGYRPAVNLLNKYDLPNISCITALELMNGAVNKRDLTRIIDKMQYFNIIWLDTSASKEALEIFGKAKLENNLGLLDCLIASTAIINRLVLFTRNVKHFRGVGNLMVKKPY